MARQVESGVLKASMPCPWGTSLCIGDWPIVPESCLLLVLKARRSFEEYYGGSVRRQAAFARPFRLIDVDEVTVLGLGL